MMKQPHSHEHPWIIAARERGWGTVMLSALDIVEPVAPVLAQVLWVVQPTAALFGGTHALEKFAEALETPEGVADLRAQLQEDET